MAETSGQALIRGLNIDKLAKGFADKVFVMKNFVQVSKTNAREIRWYQKGTSFNALLDSTDTTGITASQILNTADKALPVVVEQAWTRKTSYVQKYFVESPLISMEDIKDVDVDILATNVRDLVRAVANQVDAQIYSVLTEGQSPSDINTTAAAGTGWDDLTNGNPILDLLTAQRKIAESNYDISRGGVVAMNPIEYQHLINYLITVKGSSIPAFSSEKVRSGVVLELLGLKVVVTTTAVTDSVVTFISGRSATWKSFMPMSSVVIDDPGIGKKIRAWEEGVCLLTDPKSVHLTTDTIT
jgi:hypothetical protein